MLTSTISTSITNGITLGSGGTILTLLSSGIINTNSDGIYSLSFPSNTTIASSQFNTIINNGSILSRASFSGIDVKSYAFIKNQGLISGGYGIKLEQDGNLTNSGSIIGLTYGLALYQGGTVANSSYIGSSYIGVVLETTKANSPSPNILSNSGEIYGKTAGMGIQYGYVTNTGLISGGTFGVAMASGTLTNIGHIIGKKYGVVLTTGTISSSPLGVIENNGQITGGVAGASVEGNRILVNNAFISGSTYGVVVNSATLTTSGTISGPKDAVVASGLVLNVDPGAIFIGNVVDGGALNGTLNLSGTGSGVLNGLGTSFTGFQFINFGGANWTLSGNSAGFASNDRITGFSHGDIIELTGFAATAESFVSGTGLQLTSGSTTRTIDFTGSYTGYSFAVSKSGSTTTISLVADAAFSSIGKSWQVPVTLGSSQYASNLTVTNTGWLSSTSADAAVLTSGGQTLTNNGTITAVGAAILDESGGSIINNAIVASQTGPGISLVNGGNIITTGSISGAQDAIYNQSGQLNLTIAAGSVFNGAVVDEVGNGQLDFTGATKDVTLSNNLFGFNQINLTGASWTLEGSIQALAGGETLTGFQASDTLILDGFIATDTDVASAGLVLSTGTNIETILGSLSNYQFSVSTGGGNTTITASIAEINSVKSQGVTLNSGHYLNTIAIGRNGSVSVNSLYINAVYASRQVDNAIIINAGTITNNAHSIFGVAINTEGASTILNSGLISGSNGIKVYENSTINNVGTILATYGYGLEGFFFNTLENSGSIIAIQCGIDLAGGAATNFGLIEGGQNGVILSGADTLTNSGKIYGLGHYGVYTRLSDAYNETIVNLGFISGKKTGIWLLNGGVIADTGTISGGIYAIENLAVGSSYAPAHALTLTIDPGAVLNGNVADKSNKGQIILAGTTAGTLNIADPFSGFSGITFAAGAHWTLTGTSGELAAGQTITGFTLGDAIALTDFTPTSSTYVSGTGLILSDGTSTETLNLTGSLNSTAFAVSDGLVGALCFARGTKIHTPKGKRRIENLEIGEKILTRDGAEQEIKWIGRRSYGGRFIENNHLALPVTIKAHALAKNVPSRDLTVSPGHGIFISGNLIPAWRLINGVTITQAERVDQIDYFHIELGRHSVVLAENCPAESFLDIGLRQQFHNADEYTGTPATQAVALPRLEDGFLLQTIQRRLNLRAGILLCPEPTGALRGCIDEASPTAIRGWANCAAAPDTPISLDIFVDGAHHATILANAYRPDLRAAGLGSGCHGFALPGVPGRIDLRRSLDATPLPHAPHACAA